MSERDKDAWTIIDKGSARRFNGDRLLRLKRPSNLCVWPDGLMMCAKKLTSGAALGSWFAGRARRRESKVEAADYDAGPIEVLIRVCLALRKKVEIDCSGQEPGAKCRVTLLSA